MEKAQKTALARFGIDPDQIIHEDGRYWMTAEQLGKALGFQRPRQSVVNILNRHRDELEPFICVTSMVTQITGRGSGAKETTLIDTEGQRTIALLANTPKAARFRAFVVNLLKELERDEFHSLRRQAERMREWQDKLTEWRNDLIFMGVHKVLRTSKVMDWEKYDRMVRYRKLGLTQKETAKLLDVSKDTIQKMEAIPRKYELTALEGGAR